MSIELLSELQAVFSQHADPIRAQGQQAYLKSSMLCWGIRTPEVRQISHEIFKRYIPQSNQEYREMLLYLFKNAERREEWYAGLNYAKKFKIFITEDNLDVYIEIIRLTQWWDIVDDCAVHLVGGALKNVSDISAYLCVWIEDNNFWVRRTALLAQLSYKKETNTQLLAELILTVAHEKEFFIRKAIGWVLRQYSYTDPQWVKTFIVTHKSKLSGLSVREGLKRINKLGK